MPAGMRSKRRLPAYERRPSDAACRLGARDRLAPSRISGGYDLPVLPTRQSPANDSAMASPRRAARRSTPWWEAEMATEPENQSLTRRHRQVLKVLARAPPRGRDVNALLTLGFKLETMA